ncbi:MAG: hypothetical protein KA113_07730, partial [Syntrophaceae bacterium]|nr:hypothetical protein [Syntrophaceae bacterium]
PINAMARGSNKDVKNDRESMSAPFLQHPKSSNAIRVLRRLRRLGRFRVRTMAHLQKNINTGRGRRRNRGLDIFPRWYIGRIKRTTCPAAPGFRPAGGLRIF